MPPAGVRTIRDQILWQYSRLISQSAGLETQRAFQLKKYAELKEGKVQWSSFVMDWLKQHDQSDTCVYCGSRENILPDHLIPLSRGGPDAIENRVNVCSNCKADKNSRRIYEWKGVKGKDHISPIAESKYLLLLYSLHEKLGTLDIDRTRLPSQLCPLCDEAAYCIEGDTVGELSPFCLEGIFRKQD